MVTAILHHSFNSSLYIRFKSHAVIYMQIPYTSGFQRLYKLVNFHFLHQLWRQQRKDFFPIGDSRLDSMNI